MGLIRFALVLPAAALIMALPARPMPGGRDVCTKGSEFEPPLCPLNLPKIASIRITGNAVKAPAETDPAIDCRGFVMTEPLLRRYFASARRTDEHNARYTLDWSPCHAVGEITFANGRRATWSVDHGRVGWLMIGNSPRVTVYCRRCAFGPFSR